MNCDSNKIKLARYNRKAFTFMEVVMAVMILAFVATSILTVMNRCIEAAMDSKTKLEAFEIARENMEFLLAADKVSEKTEFGISETNPDIQWETVVETFTEPVTSSMWLQAVCSASYTDNDGQLQSVELTHWLSEVPEDIQKKIKAQQKKEREMMEGNDEEYKRNLAKALGINSDEIDNFDITELEEIAKDEGIDPDDFVPDSPTTTDPDEEYEPEGRTYDPSKPITVYNYPLHWTIGELVEYLIAQKNAK